MSKDTLPSIICKALLLACLFFYLLPIQSCQSSHQTELQQLDSLLILLDRSKNLLNAIDSDQVIAYSGEIKNNLAFIQANYNDTLDKDLAIFLLNYRSIKKSLDNYLQVNPAIQQEMDVTQTQVKALRMDIKNKALNTQQVQAYYLQEKTRAIKLIDTVTFLTGNVKEAITTFEAMNPRVREFVDNLQSNQSKTVEK